MSESTTVKSGQDQESVPCRADALLGDSALLSLGAIKTPRLRGAEITL